MTVQGEVAGGFEPVKDAFERNFAQHGEVGAAVCVYVGGRKVVDLWGGVADAHTGREWVEDTPAVVYSTTKGVTAICAHLLAQRGELDLDAPTSDYWPEFKAAGKEHVPVRWLLGHRAGLPVLSERITPQELYAWDPVVEALAAQAPIWEPGTKHGYHAVTYGYLVGEVIRRVTGRSIGRFLAEEIAGPLDLDVWIGLPTDREGTPARLVSFEAPPSLSDGDDFLSTLPEEVQRMARAFLDPDSLTQRALNITEPAPEFNSVELHRAEIPAAGGIANARGLAKLYAACIGEIDGRRLLTDATVADASKEVSSGPDEILMIPTRFGSGFFLSSDFSPLYGPRAFGHAGAGGSLAMADPESGVAFGYVMNKMQANLSGDPRTVDLMAAVKASLAA